MLVHFQMLSFCLPYLYRQLASMNLPAALEDTTGTEVPQSLLEKSAAVKNAGGLQQLEEQLFNLPSLLERNEEILSEVGRFPQENRKWKKNHKQLLPSSTLICV